MDSHESNRKPSLLIIDPEEASARRLAEYMAERDWLVYTARTFAEARTFMTAAPFELAVVELVLPDALAIDVWNFLRKLYPAISGFITTSKRSLYHSVNPTGPGIIAFLLKPFEFRVIEEFAAQIMQGQRLTAENRAIEQRLSALHAFTSHIAAARTPRQALESAIAHFEGVVHADWIVIDLLDGEGSASSMVKVGGALMGTGEWSADLIRLLGRLRREVVTTLQPITLDDDLLLEPKYNITELEQLNLSALVMMPILAEGHVLGTVTVMNRKGVRNKFSSLDIRMVVLQSQALGLALLNLSRTQELPEAVST